MKRVLGVVAAVLALIAGGVVVTVTVDDGDPATPPRHIEIKVPGSAPVQVDADQQQERPEQEEAAAGTHPGVSPAGAVGPDVHEDARDETPAGIEPGEAAEIVNGETSGVGEPRPVGGAENLDCRRNLVRNRSSRGGAKVKLVVLHYTVSRPGTLDVIRRLFDTPSFAASSHIGLEPSGRCELWVPYPEKAWTEGAFNPVGESVEIMAMGTEPRSWWLAQPIISKGLLASWVRDRLRANGLPLRRVDPVGCAVQQAGWTDHDALECGNSHHDVQPAFPYDVLQRQIVAGGCDARCVRTRRLRKLHAEGHAFLRANRCFSARPKTHLCGAAIKRNRQIHNRAELKKISLGR